MAHRLDLNVKPDELKLGGEYTQYPSDYCATAKNESGKINIGLAHIKGHRPSQEDEMKCSVNAVQLFKSLSYATRKLVLVRTFKELQEKYGQTEEGSTACIATCWTDEKKTLHVTTANLGDSAAYLVITNRWKSSKVKRLNELHKPTTPSEKARLDKEKANVFFERLDGVLAVSRAFGDQAFEKNGLSHIPEVADCEIQLSAGQQAFVLVACDGLDSLSLKMLGDIIAKNRNKTPAVIANTLIDKALAANSLDNISVACIPISDLPANTPVSAAVFDGHGGDQVSRDVGEHFYDCLANHLSAVLQSDNTFSMGLFAAKNQSPQVIDEKINKRKACLIL